MEIHPMNQSTLTPEDLTFLASLESQLTCEATDSRIFPRLHLSLPFSVRPADTSRSEEDERLGVTADASRGGFRGSMGRPLAIGDHYRVQLIVAGGQTVELIARCLRCAFLDEQEFEVVLRFVAPLDKGVLPDPDEN
jgi:hypothetical protein